MRTIMRGYSPILVSAALSIAVLVSVAGMRLGGYFASAQSAPQERIPAEMPVYVPVEDTDGNGVPDWQDALEKSGISVSSTTPATTTDPLSLIAGNVAQSLYGGYLLLKEYDQYTPERGEELGKSVASAISAPLEITPFTVHDLTLGNVDTLEYRSDMRTAVEPIITDDLPELEFYARYVSTKDATWLIELSDAAKRYRAAVENVRAVQAPTEAAPEHLRTLNSLLSYAVVLESMSKPIDDAFAHAALLNSFNDAEQELFNAFNALAQYYVRTVAIQ